MPGVASVGRRPLEADLLPDFTRRDPTAAPAVDDLQRQLEGTVRVQASRRDDEERSARRIGRDGDRCRGERFAGLHGGEVVGEGGVRTSGRDLDRGVALESERHRSDQCEVSPVSNPSAKIPGNVSVSVAELSAVFGSVPPPFTVAVAVFTSVPVAVGDTVQVAL